MRYCKAAKERQRLIDEYGWTIKEDSLDCSAP
jgi:hypothetical protein